MREFKNYKSGLSTASKYADRPMQNYEKISLKDRAIRHQLAHPNDKNIKREDRSIQWSKSRTTTKEKQLKEFYKTHVYSWISNTQRGWIALPTGEEE